MPPFVPRKRSRTPEDTEPSIPAKKRNTKQIKPTLFEAVDSPTAKFVNSSKTTQFLDNIGGDDSSSEAGSDEFENVADVEDEEHDDEMVWEDATIRSAQEQEQEQEQEIGDVVVSLREDGSYVEPLVSAATGKKGPSKRERRIRVLVHTLHVQALMWHNTVRNSWLNDKEVQKILYDALPVGVRHEIFVWRRSMGMLSKEELDKAKATTARRAEKKGRPVKNLKGRDWSYSAEHSEVGTIDYSNGDPMLRLLRMMTQYWRKRFDITAPGIRKKGYLPLRKMREEINTWKEDPTNEQHGERINNIKEFRELARVCQGSRDVGGQLFVALLRSIGLTVRMVTNLQPAGFGWGKTEDANVKITKQEAINKPVKTKPAKPLPPPKLREALTPKNLKKPPKEDGSRRPLRGNKAQPIKIVDTDSDLSDPPSELDDDDLSVVDMTEIPRKKSTRRFDIDLSFPVYWAEVLSPASNKYIPVDPIVLSTIASTEELLQTFEPRGAKADKSKQVICYAIAFNSDGTAKDVTVRYLKRHQLPGKTKGMRLPGERVPIYNRKGKIKSYEERDWFPEMMLSWKQLDSKRMKADDLEDDNELKPFKPAKEDKILDKESLAYYKASADYVLEEHLRREEALLPHAEPVKTITAGKGDKVKEYDVYKRTDVVNCKTVESWHKEGRGLLPGQQPMKYVPIRAVTLQRKREIEDAQRETGEKLKQGLYSEAQTDWIIPPPIVDGVIPKNAFGNMDVYVPTMVPAGAVHLGMKGTAKVCKRLGIDYAEACTGFEFGKQRAVPVITGVVVAKENAAAVRREWKIDRDEAQRKEDVKRTAAALHWWRKMLLGLRIIDRMKAEYANTSTAEDEYNPFVRKAAPVSNSDHDTGGGFLLGDEEGVKGESPVPEAGGFLVEHDDIDEVEPTTSKHNIKSAVPVSLQNLHVAEGQQERTRKIVQPTSNIEKENSKPNTKKKQKLLVKEVSSDDELQLKELEAVNTKLSVKTKSAHTRRNGRVKVSPTKSPYFSSQEPNDVMTNDEEDGVEQDDQDEEDLDDHDDHNDEDGDEDDQDDQDEDESEGEVIAVRKTTARTRSKR